MTTSVRLLGLGVATVFVAGCDTPTPISEKNKEDAEAACDRLSQRLFPDTVNGVYELKVGEPRFEGIEGENSAGFVIRYTWYQSPDETVDLVCKVNADARTIEYLEFLGIKKVADATESWSY